MVKIPEHSQVTLHHGPEWWLLPTAVAFGLSGGLIEVAIVAVRKYWLKEMITLSPHFVWMVPVTAVVICSIIGFVLLLVTLPLAQKMSSRVVIFMLAVFGFLSPLLAVPRLDFYATLLLTGGLSVQTARFLAARIDSHHTKFWPTIKWMAGFVICLGLGVHAWQLVSERNAVAKLPSPRPNAPNIILIVLDTVRAESLSLYSHPRPTTPNLERLAKTSIVFDRAFSTSPWTLPSHASMFTGRWPHELSTEWQTPLDGTYPTLAEVLSAHGYATAGFVANLIYASSVHGLNRGFIHYEDFPVSVGQAILSSSLGAMIGTYNRLRYWLNYHRVLNRKTAAEVNEEFLSWLSNRDQRPFFAFLNYMDAHEPYLPPKPFDSGFGPKRSRVKFWHTRIDAFLPSKWKMSPEEVQAEIAAYEGVVAYIDHEVGLLVAELERRGMLENTLVIIASDHGEQLGEHRLFGHGNSLYRQLLHVPLLIYFHDHVPAGKVIHDPVTLRDIPATVIDLIGLEGPASFPGTSLTRYWQKPKEPRRPKDELLISEAHRTEFGHPWYPLIKGDMTSLVFAGYHYIKNSDGREELYDFEDDPAEQRDLASSQEVQAALKRFRKWVETSLAGHHGQTDGEGKRLVGAVRDAK